MRVGLASRQKDEFVSADDCGGDSDQDDSTLGEMSLVYDGRSPDSIRAEHRHGNDLTWTV